MTMFNGEEMRQRLEEHLRQVKVRKDARENTPAESRIIPATTDVQKSEN